MSKNMQAQRNFCDSVTLLPYNAAKFERDVEKALRYSADTSSLSGFKFGTAGENLSLALSWEYSLAQINIDDFEKRVIEGLKFYRLAGTPYALRMALSWYGFNEIKIEEEEPGKHFAEFQIGLNGIPNNLDISQIISAAELAAPLRSRLSRMYNDLYDIRRFILDYSDWGDILSDHSGNYLYEGSPKFSFGRVNTFDVEVAPLDYTYVYNILRIHYAFAENNDRKKLDWTILDEEEPDVLNYEMTRSLFHFMHNTNHVFDGNDSLFRTRTTAKALITLSEDCTLEDINACFSCGYEDITEEPFILSYHYLSEGRVDREQVLVAYREFRSGEPVYAKNKFEPDAIRGFKTNVTCMTCEMKTTTEFSRTVIRNLVGEYRGNNIWHDQKHFDETWINQRHCLGMIRDIGTA